MKKLRIVKDNFSGFEVQIWRIWWPFWVECWQYGIINTFSTLEKAEEWANERINKRTSKFPKLKSKPIKIITK